MAVLDFYSVMRTARAFKVKERYIYYIDKAMLKNKVGEVQDRKLWKTAKHRMDPDHGNDLNLYGAFSVFIFQIMNSSSIKTVIQLTIAT